MFFARWERSLYYLSVLIVIIYMLLNIFTFQFTINNDVFAIIFSRAECARSIRQIYFSIQFSSSFTYELIPQQFVSKNIKIWKSSIR